MVGQLSTAQYPLATNRTIFRVLRWREKHHWYGAPHKMDLAKGHHHPVKEMGWSLQHIGHGWDPAYGQPGVYRGSGCYSWWFCRTGGRVKTHEQFTPVLGPCLCEWVVPVTRSEKGRLWTLAQRHVPAEWLVGFLISFFFPCLSFALSGLIGSVCNSGSKLIFESTLPLFSPRYHGSLH